MRGQIPRTHLARIRYDAGFETATQVAEKLNRHQSTISAVERGAKMPSDELIGLLSKVYRRPVAELMAAWEKDNVIYQKYESVKRDRALKRAGVKGRA